jgi:hypothetical protein
MGEAPFLPRKLKELKHVKKAVQLWLLAFATSLLFIGASNAQTWNVVWSDEFNGAAGSAPSSANWTYDTGAGGWGNNEL